jgi:hypothetical protein
VARRLVDDDEPPRLRDRLEDRRQVERRQRARVDHLRLDARLRELRGRRQRLPDHVADRHDRDVAARAPDRRLAERDDVLALRHLARLQRQQVVVEVDDGVVVADRGRHQPLRVRRRRRHRHLQARDAHEHPVDRAGVLAGPAGGEAVARLEDDRDRHLPAAHVVEARRLVHDLVHRDEHELRHVQLDHRPVAGERRPDRHPDLRGLRDRRHADAVGPEGLQERVVLGRGDVLAEVEDGLVALHLLADRLFDRGDVGQLACHRSASSRRRRS